MSDSTPTTTDHPAAADPAARRVIEIGDGQLHRWADEAWSSIIEANDPERPEVMLHGNDLVRLSEDGLVPFNVASLRDRLSRVAAFFHRQGDTSKPTTPPREVADALLARTPDEFPGAPRIERITDVPLLLPDGSILDRPGYHADHRIYYLPAEDLDGLRIAGPGGVEYVDEVENARDYLLDDWLGEFGFADEASRANALAMLLTPFVREFIGTGVPLFPVLASQWGWGKSLLTDAVFIPTVGDVPPKATGASGEDEMRKRITATLRAVPSVIVVDNLSGELSSGALASVLTSGVWQDRILGESRDLIIRPRCVWSVNGNNLSMSGELVDRCPAPIVLGPGAYWDDLCARKGWDSGLRPRELGKGSYSHDDLRAWSKANRRQAIEAVFVLIRHWLDGKPDLIDGGHRFYRPALDHDLPLEERAGRVLPVKTTGEFAEWQGVVGGILAAAHVEGFADNYATWASTTDDEGQEVAAFYAAWRALDLPPVELKEVVKLCQPLGPLRDALPTDLASVPSDRLPVKLRAWLRDHKGEKHHGYRLVAEETRQGRPNRWSILGGNA